MAEVATLKQRIERAAERRAALVERKAQREQELAEATARLKELDLTPKNAEAKIAEAQADLEASIAAVEKTLGL